MKRGAAGIGYGFLVGAGLGLFVGVITRNLFYWIVIGAVAGIVLGCIFSFVFNR